MRTSPIVLLLSLVAVLAGVLVTPASAASFDDSKPCPAQGALLVCPNGEVGKPYTLQLLGKAGCDLYRWEVPNGSLPAGLSLSSSGLISGTPTAAGASQFWVHIHDLLPSEGGYPWCAFDNQSERQFVIRIVPGLSINNQSVRPGMVGQPYSETLAATEVFTVNPVTGPPAAVTWTVQSGTLPPGVTLSSGGALQGTPTTAGTYQFVVRAQNGGQFDTETLNLTVVEELDIAQPVVRPAELGIPFKLQLQATGGGPPGAPLYKWSLANGTVLPTGLSLNAETGEISGTPTVAGSFPIKVAVADGMTPPFSATADVVLGIAAKLAITIKKLAARKIGLPYRAKIATNGGVGPFVWRIVNGRLPRGLRLDPSTGVLSGTPLEAGRFAVTVGVTDSLGARATGPILVSVFAPKLVIVTKRLAARKIGLPYRAQIAATGGFGPRIWRIVNGRLPRGLRLDRKTGVLSGTPLEAGTFRVIFQVTDKLGAVFRKTLVITVLP